MIPNARLMIVAILASILGMSCGLGVFAAFRVNHDPFIRLPGAPPPLRLVLANAVPAPVSDAAVPFGARFQIGSPPNSDVAVSGAGREQAPPAMPEQAALPAVVDEPVETNAAAETTAPAMSEPVAPHEAKPDVTTQSAIEPATEPSAPPAKRGDAAQRRPKSAAPVGAKTMAKAARTLAKRPRVVAAKPPLRKAHTRLSTQSTDQNSGAWPSYPSPLQ